MKILLFCIIFNILLYSHEDSCRVDDNLMLSILFTEKHPKREVGYPYIISFNNKNDSIFAQKELKKYFVDNRTLDCRNEKACIAILEYLKSNNINNLDLGAFQINSYYHEHPVEQYFDIDESYNIACDYISNIIEKHGYSWESIAAYHSHTEILNTRYKKTIQQHYIKLTKKQ